MITSKNNTNIHDHTTDNNDNNDNSNSISVVTISIACIISSPQSMNIWPDSAAPPTVTQMPGVPPGA